MSVFFGNGVGTRMRPTSPVLSVLVVSVADADTFCPPGLAAGDGAVLEGERKSCEGAFTAWGEEEEAGPGTTVELETACC